MVAIPDPKWQERPLPCVVLRPGCSVDLEDLQAHLSAAASPAGSSPTASRSSTRSPKTSVGKFDKKMLRARLAAPDE